MTVLTAWKEHFVRGALALLCGLTVYAGFVQASGRIPGNQDIPGPLSAAHVLKPGEADCSACHVAAGKVSPAKCLACHTEIASRIAAQKGYHRDKADDCAVCHVEHQGRQANIVPLEPASFDHTETGADIRGAHRMSKDCATCHTPANSYPRSQGRSYLLKVPGCRGCHTPPHPGRQDSCLACHTQESWTVERRRAEG
ncbi:MAG: hypothetical protein NT147_05910 [Candidatus Aminicenantes bacterium]|nr:hypothetical protein [Candidatus Aminicenantes bacterium]